MVERVSLRPAEAAEAIGCNIATLYRWRRKGLLRIVRIENSAFVPMADINRLLGLSPDALVGQTVGQGAPAAERTPDISMA